MQFAPTLQNIERPGTRPGRMPLLEILPDFPYSLSIQHRGQGAVGNVLQSRLHAGMQFIAQPVFERKGESALTTVNNFMWQLPAKRGYQQRFRRMGIQFPVARKGKQLFSQMMIDQWNSYFESVSHTHHVRIS